jgi:XTP/dITP diphosphohydrolase
MTRGALAARLASVNPGKTRELGALLAPRIVLSPPPAGFAMPEETGRTYEENALVKARALARATGEPALGDDSGIEVDALGGRPGIHSARYAPTDRERIARLLAEIAGVPRERRGARFRCVLALVFPGGRELSAEGVCEGEIATAPRGSGGFGYDPVFLIPALGRTVAELIPDEKARVSHRAAAARRLLGRLGDG